MLWPSALVLQCCGAIGPGGAGRQGTDEGCLSPAVMVLSLRCGGPSKQEPQDEKGVNWRRSGRVSTCGCTELSQAPEVTSTWGPPVEEALTETCRGRRVRKLPGMGKIKKAQQPDWKAVAVVGWVQPVDTADSSEVMVLKAEVEQKLVSNYILLIYIYI